MLLGLGCRPEVLGPARTYDEDPRREYDAGSGVDATTPPVDAGTSTVDSGPVIAPGCNGECNALQATACTCDLSDPCDWIGFGSNSLISCQVYISGSIRRNIIQFISVLAFITKKPARDEITVRVEHAMKSLVVIGI